MDTFTIGITMSETISCWLGYKREGLKPYGATPTFLNWDLPPESSQYGTLRPTITT